MPLRAESLDLPAYGLRPEIYRGGTGTPLVYLHAAGGIGPHDPVANALAEHFEVVAPVHPGFRGLEEIDELRDVHDLALYYDDLLDTLALDGVAVMGHSFGGMIAAELAAHSPRRVGVLVLCCPIGLWRDDEPVADLFAAFPDAVNDLLWADPAAPVVADYTTAAVRDLPGSDAEDPFLGMLLSLVQGLATAGKYMWPIPDKGLRRRLHRIAAPTLVIWGAKDKLVPASYADDFVAGIREAEAEILPDAGHMVPAERTEEVVSLVARFVSMTRTGS